MPPIYQIAADTYELSHLVAFDFETYLINDTLASPRAVCGSFASFEPLAPFFEEVAECVVLPEGSWHEEERDFGGQPVYVALAEGDTAALVVLALLINAVDRSFSARPLVLVGQNVAFDFGVTLNRIRLLEKMGTLSRDLVPGLKAFPEAWSVEVCARALIMRAHDTEATGFPDSPGVVADTKIRELLIKNAAGEMLVNVDLGSLVRKYLNEDRSAEKKGAPCSKCAATGKVTVPDPGSKKGVKSETCPTCNGSKALTPWRLKYHTLDGTPLAEWPDQAREYAMEDAIDTLAVVIAQSGPAGADDFAVESEAVIVDGYGNVRDEAHQTRAAWALELCRMNGPRSDSDTIERYRTEMEALATVGEEIGQNLGFIRQDGTRDTKIHAALVEAAYARMGKRAPRTAPSTRFPDGQISTDEDTVRLSRDERLIEYLDTNEARLALSKFIPAAERAREGALASSPGVFVATGRTSWANPMLHQPPRKGAFRSCWHARPGHVYVSCDWKAAEMVALAQILVFMFGRSNMADAINEGRDLHTSLAVHLHNAQHPEDPVDYEEMARRIKAGDKDAKALRQFAKIANFGFPGGLSAHSFVDYARGYGVVITENQAEGIRDGWLAAWPEMYDYLEAFKEAASGGSFTFVHWITGRIRGQVRFTNGCNGGFQGLVADALKIALWWATWEMYVPVLAESKDATVEIPHSPGETETARLLSVKIPRLHAARSGYVASPLYGSRSWLSIHDEILLETPEGVASPAAKRLGLLMRWALRYLTPEVETDADPALMRVWDKDAEAVYDADGNLIPWEDRPRVSGSAS